MKLEIVAQNSEEMLKHNKSLNVRQAYQCPTCHIGGVMTALQFMELTKDCKKCTWRNK